MNISKDAQAAHLILSMNPIIAHMTDKKLNQSGGTSLLLSTQSLNGMMLSGLLGSPFIYIIVKKANKISIVIKVVFLYII
jgi:hypothetical protein